MSPPAFLSKKSLAHELDVSESTVDEFVRRGVLPKPLRLSTGCIRWSWEAVRASLASLEGHADASASDPYMAGLANAEKTTRAGHG